VSNKVGFYPTEIIFEFWFGYKKSNQNFECEL